MNESLLEPEGRIFYPVFFAILPVSLTFLLICCVYVCILDKLLITNSMNCTVANILSPSQDIKRILCNQHVHYRSYKG